MLSVCVCVYVCVCVCVVPFSNKLMSLVTSSNGVIPPRLVQLTSMYWSPFWFTQKMRLDTYHYYIHIVHNYIHNYV